MSSKSFDLAYFKQSIKAEGISRSSRFEILLIPPAGITNFRAKETSVRCHTGALPPMNVVTKDYSVGQGQLRKMPHGYDHGHTLEYTFYNNAKSDIYAGLLNWLKLVFPANKENDYEVGYYSDYASGSVTVRQMNERDEITFVSILKEAYPIKVDQIILDSQEHNTAQLVKVTFAYRYAVIGTTIPDSAEKEPTQITQKYNTITQSDMTYNTIPDPSMTRMVSIKGQGATNAELLSASESSTQQAIDSGNVVSQEQTTNWDNQISDTTSVINNPTATTTELQSAKTTLQSAHGNVTQSVTGYYANVTTANTAYNKAVATGTVTQESPTATKMTTLKEQSKQIVSNQVAVDKTYSDAITAVNKKITTVQYGQ